MTTSTLRGGILAAILAWPLTGRADSLEARVEAVLNSPGYQSGHWGVLVVDEKTGKTIFERGADRMFGPASVTKLFTGASALVELGEDYRFKTPVVRRGEVDRQGTLRGDLILVAKGDLSLGGRTGPSGTLLFEDNDHSYAGGNLDATLVPADPLAGLVHLAREVREAGIRAVSGDVLVDDRLFEAAPSSGSGPSRVSPVVINDNVVDVVVSPAAKAGDPAEVAAVPASPFFAMDARVETTAEGTRPSVRVEAVGPRRFTVRGQLPVGHRKVVKIHEVKEPAAFARALFIEALRSRGVDVSASPLGDNHAGRLPGPDDVAGLPKVAEYTSPPFKEYLRVILKVSQNLHASTLPLLIAAKHGKSSLSDGLRLEADALKGLGVDVKTISFGGGAGGERADLVTPRATVALLRAMARRPDFPAFQAALPILGRDGTLARSVSAESPARGHVRAKTGTYWVENGLDGRAILTSKALAGFLETASGRSLAFAFFVNDIPLEPGPGGTSEATAEAGRLLGTLCEVFYADAPPEGARSSRSTP